MACSRTPCVVAEITVDALVAMPTCDAPPPSVLKNTRSPAWIADWLTGVPTVNWEKLVRGRLIPARPNAHWTSPEQSKPPGAAPAVRYGVPTWLRAAATAASAPEPEPEPDVG